MDLLLNIGNWILKGMLFDNGKIVNSFILDLNVEQLYQKLLGEKIDRAFCSSSNPKMQEQIAALFLKASLPFSFFDPQKDCPSQAKIIGEDKNRLANAFGALFHFPQNDCIIVNIGTDVYLDYISCNGGYQGGVIYPLFGFSCQKLHEKMAKSQEQQVQIGRFWGLLGAIERITSEMRRATVSPSNVKIIATWDTKIDLREELQDIVDLLDPMLNMIGLHEIMKEKNNVK